jgi:hypothetical protein
MVGIVIGLKCGWVEGLKSGCEDDGPHVQLQFFGPLRMGLQGDGIRATGLHTLITLAAIAAVEASTGFVGPGLRVIAEFHFIEVPCTFLRRKFRHFGPRLGLFFLGDGPIYGVIR